MGFPLSLTPPCALCPTRQVNQNFVTNGPLGPLPIAGDRLQNSTDAEIWAKPVPIPPGHKGKAAVAVVLFNRAEQGGRIVFDFGLLGESFEGSDAAIFDVIAGKNISSNASGSHASGNIASHGCEFIVVIFQSASSRSPLKTDDAAVSKLQSNGEVAGFHVDIETCSGNYGKTHGGHTVAQQRAACASFFGKLENISRAAASISKTLPHPLTLAVDTGTGWACGEEPASGCINITWNGVSKPVSQHVVDLSNSTVLMDYTRDPAKVYSRALPNLAYADTLEDGAACVRVGVAIGCVPGQTRPGGDSMPCAVPAWATRNDSELATLLATAEPLLRKHRSFGGFAVFHDGYWFEQFLSNPAPAGTRWPLGTAGWYSKPHSAARSCPTARVAHVGEGTLRRSSSRRTRPMCRLSEAAGAVRGRRRSASF